MKLRLFPRLLLVFASLLVITAISATKVFAATYVCNMAIQGQPGNDDVFTLPDQPVIVGSKDVRSLTGELANSSDGTFFLELGPTGGYGAVPISVNISNGTFSSNLGTQIVSIIGNSTSIENFEVRLMRNTIPGSAINRETVCHTNFQARNSPGNKPGAKYSCGSPGISVTRTGSEIINIAVSVSAKELPTRTYTAYFVISGAGGSAIKSIPLTLSGGNYNGIFSGNLPDGDYTIVESDQSFRPIDIRTLAPSDISNCIQSFTVSRSVPECNDPSKCTVQPNQPPTGKVPFLLCKQAATKDEQKACNLCLCGQDSCEGVVLDPNKSGIWTSVGCIPTSAQGIVDSILRLGLGLAGGVVVLAVLAGAFMLTTSAGNPKQVEEAQQIISSAIIGLLFVVFSIIILQFFGVSILHLPGFGATK